MKRGQVGGEGDAEASKMAVTAAQCGRTGGGSSRAGGVQLWDRQ